MDTHDHPGRNSIPSGINQHILPGILKEIAEIAGMDVAISVLLQKRGKRLYIPCVKQLNRSRLFIGIVGKDSAEKISAALGGMSYTIPTARPVLRAYRARILRTAGYSAAQIATILDMDRSHVQRLAPKHHYPTGDVDPKVLQSIFDDAPARFANMKPMEPLEGEKRACGI